MTHRVYRHQVTPMITAVKVTMDGVFGRPDAPDSGPIVGQERTGADEGADQTGESAR
jgi:hypothetical protein